MCLSLFKYPLRFEKHTLQQFLFSKNISRLTICHYQYTILWWHTPVPSRARWIMSIYNIIILTCDLFISTCQLTKLTCNICVSICHLFLLQVNTFMLLVKINNLHVNVIMTMLTYCYSSCMLDAETCDLTV